MTAVTAAPVTLFYSYAHEDEPLRDELQGHLKILERRGLLAPWHDRKIVPGEAWEARIDDHLLGADLVLLLVSTDFINSDYIMGREVALAMQRHDAGDATVVPILVRAVNVEPEDADALPFLRLQGLPTDLRPVTSWPNRDEAWTNVAKGLRATVHAIRVRRPAPPAAPPMAPPPAPPPPAAAAPDGAAPSAGAPQAPSPPVLGSPAPAPRLAPAAPLRDPLLERVVDQVAASVRDATRQRGGAPVDEDTVRAEALRLIDVPDQRRILWVDDRPEGNRYEIAALAKLQIEVVTARSTAEARQRLAESEPFDLVISDWDRRGESREAGLALGRWLRVTRPGVPFVYYHGEFDPGRRATRARQALAAGALGDAVTPAELLALVLQAFRA